MLKPRYFLFVAIPIICCLLTPFECLSNNDDENRVREAETRAAVKLGRATAATMMQGSVHLFAPEVQEEIQTITNEIADAANSPIQHRIHIINDPSMNLFTLPSGDIFVFTGFFDKIENRDELAFGIAHEIAHSCLDHGLRKMKHTLDEQQRATLVAQILVGLVATTVGTITANSLPVANIGVWEPFYDQLGRGYVGNVVARLAGKITADAIIENMLTVIGSYSQAQEAEADRYAMIYMKKAGYNPSAAITAMEKFSDVLH